MTTTPTTTALRRTSGLYDLVTVKRLAETEMATLAALQHLTDQVAALAAVVHSLTPRPSDACLSAPDYDGGSASTETVNSSTPE